MTKNKKFFSIITVSKNDLSGLKKTYLSIKKLNYKNFEWIVVLKKYTKKNLEIFKKEKKINAKIISNKDKNLWDAMNIGIKNSSGEYLIFMNSGDLFYKKGILNKVFNLASKKKYPDIIYGDTIEKIKNIKHYKKSLNHKYAYYGMFANHQSIFFKKKIFDIYKRPFDYINYKYSADYALIAKFIKSKKKFFYFNEIISIFSYGGMSYSKQYLNNSRREHFKIKKKIFKMNYFSIFFIYAIQNLLWFIRTFLNPIYKHIRYYKQ
jgi:putative colanic acid biosynthesis glycosyltransferase